MDVHNLTKYEVAKHEIHQKALNIYLYGRKLAHVVDNHLLRMRINACLSSAFNDIISCGCYGDGNLALQDCFWTLHKMQLRHVKTVVSSEVGDGTTYVAACA